jgi:hypothetical protein
MCTGVGACRPIRLLSLSMCGSVKGRCLAPYWFNSCFASWVELTRAHSSVIVDRPVFAAVFNDAHLISAGVADPAMAADLPLLDGDVDAFGHGSRERPPTR